MPDGSVPILIALVVLILLSGFFSSTETAYSCANRIKLRSLSSSGNKRAKQVLDLAETNYDRLISTILIGNNIVNIALASLGTVLFVKLLGDIGFTIPAQGCTYWNNEAMNPVDYKDLDSTPSAVASTISHSSSVGGWMISSISSRERKVSLLRYSITMLSSELSRN